MNRLTVERAKEAFLYDPETGLFTWRKPISKKVKVGQLAGNVNLLDGYVQIRLDGELHRGHRLAWLYVTGSWPQGVIDHKNGIRKDNRWINLRDTTTAVNMQNRITPNANSSSGLLGVSFTNGRPFAQIMVDGRNIRLGTFDTPEQAHEAYLAAKRKYHAECYFYEEGGRDRARREARG